MLPFNPGFLKRNTYLALGAAGLLVLTSCGVLNISISTPTKEQLNLTPTPETHPTEAIPPTEVPTPDKAEDGIPNRPLGIGPWWVFQTQDGLWAINPDASGLTQISGEISLLPMDFSDSVASRGGKLALITSTDPSRWANLALEVLSLPDGEFKRVTSLTSPESEPGPDAVPGDPAFEAVRAVADLQSFAWSPDGSALAFMGVVQGPTSDLYVYSVDTAEVTRLTDGPSQAISPIWSPDGEYIVHTGVDSLGTGAGFSMRGIWAARADDSGILDLYPIPQGSGNEVVVGWISSDQFLVYTWNVVCGPRSLRIYDLSDRSELMLWNGFFSDVAIDPNRGNVLLTIDETTAQCNDGGVQGIFLFQTDPMATFEILEFGIYQVDWAAEIGSFLARHGVELLAIGPEGGATKLASAPLEGEPLISPDGTYWAFTGTEQTGGAGIWVGDFGIEPDRVFSNGAWELSWDPDEQGFFFFSESGLFFAPAPGFSPILIAEGAQLEHDGGSAWVWP